MGLANLPKFTRAATPVSAPQRRTDPSGYGAARNVLDRLEACEGTEPVHLAQRRGGADWLDTRPSQSNAALSSSLSPAKYPQFDPFAPLPLPPKTELHAGPCIYAAESAP